jgi:hypothetical protein
MQFWKAKRLFGVKCTGAGILLAFFALQATAQNSPYSRFGLGDASNSQNAANRAMGGVSRAYADGQTINFINPASYSQLQLTTLDAGLEGGSRRITDQNDKSFNSGYGTLSYLLIGMPLKTGGGWGLTFGLTPRTKVNYDIHQQDSLTNVGENVGYLYQGNGGTYQAFVGTGFRIKGFRFGVNAGYLFGSVNHNTQAIYPQDSVGLYNSNITSRTSFGGFFWDAGMQVHVKMGSKMGLELGVSGGTKTTLKGNTDYLAETFYNTGDPADPSPQNLDTVSYVKGDRGNVVYPGHYGFGLLLHDNGHWTVGADYEVSTWSDYSFFGKVDSLDYLQDSWTLRVGAQYVPSTSPLSRSYWSMVAYRIGFYTGRDYLRYGGENMNTYAFSFGAGLPIRNFTRNGQYTIVNTAFELGKRGGTANPLSETFFRATVGFTLSDIWFIKRKYR